MRIFLLSLLTSLTLVAMGQEISVIPKPAQVSAGVGHFQLTSRTSISAPADNAAAFGVASYFIERVNRATGFSLHPSADGGDIQLHLNRLGDAELGTEGYRLTVSPQKVEAHANTPAGLFYAIQTLLQLLPASIESNTRVEVDSWTIPCVSISDFPRFPWRGAMLDVSRHFFTKDEVKKYIDELARYKYNRFHWHLTDDNGWRVEIKSYPKLTSVGAWRVPRTGTFNSNTPPKPGEAATDGGFYTQEDIREVVQYAKDRFIEILPEIDVPGHSMAAIAAYPELCVTGDTSIKVNPGTKFSTWHGDGTFTMHIDNTLNPTDEKVYTFLDGVFGEIASLFPFEYIHMGGDECYKGYWERDEKVQAFMKAHDIANGHELQSYFNKRVNAIINSKGKKMIGWDEILEGGTVEGAAVMSWRGVKGGIEASHKRLPVVMSPNPVYYLDMNQGEKTIEPPIYNNARLNEVYAFDILAPGITEQYVLGGQGNLWTEQVPTMAQAEYMTWPRAFAIAESMWSVKEQKSWPYFVRRVEQQFERFDAAGIQYATSMYDPIISVKKNSAGLLVIELTSEVDGLDLYYTLDNTWPTPYASRYAQPIVVPEDVDLFRVVSYRKGEQIGKVIGLSTDELNTRVK